VASESGLTVALNNKTKHKLWEAKLFVALGRIHECKIVTFSRWTAVPAGTAERVLAMTILSGRLAVRPSVRLSRPATETSPADIEIRDSVFSPNDESLV